MHEVDSLCDGNVPFVFFFQSKNVRELRNILRRDGFSYPICIDTEDSFNKLNRFPDVMTFQTFLVDSGNRVKVIGNPIHNLSVKELYLKELTFPLPQFILILQSIIMEQLVKIRKKARRSFSTIQAKRCSV